MDCFQRSCTMKRGIRQGCPISAFSYLFLSIKIKKIIQYMDLLKKNYKMKFKKKNMQHADNIMVTFGDIEFMIL